MTYSTNNTYYVPSTYNDRLKGYALATLASGAIMSGLPLLGKPFQKELYKEQINNSLYVDSFWKAFETSGLKEKGVRIIEAQRDPITFPVEAAGKNACYIPSLKKVVLNTEKICNAGFHELGHAMNNLKSRYGVKYLSKMRKPGYVIAGIMEYFAIFSRNKSKDEPKNLTDYIEDNCGKIAFAAMLPTVAEEGIASYRGLKLARSAGLSEPLTKNLKRLYAKALLTYAGRAVLGGLAVGASRIIMDYFSRPQKVERENWFI